MINDIATNVYCYECTLQIFAAFCGILRYVHLMFDNICNMYFVAVVQGGMLKNGLTMRFSMRSAVDDI